MKAAVLSAVVAVLRMGGNDYIAALLLVEPGRVASDGLEAPARHHLVCVDVDVCTPPTNTACPLTKLPMALILAGAWKSAEPRPLPRDIVNSAARIDNITFMH